MKIRKIISLTLTLLMLCSIVFASFTTAYAVAIKKRPKGSSNKTADDVVYLDFTEYGPGDMPAGFTGSTDKLSIVEEEVKPGVTKPCLMMTDDYPNGSTGFVINYGLSEVKGIVKVEMRYKFVADLNSEKPYNAHIFAIHSAAGASQIGRGVYVSLNGLFNSNPNTTDAAVLSSTIADGTWTTLTYYIDFDEQKMDVVLNNETKNELRYVVNSSFFDAGEHKSLVRLSWQSAQYMGSWIYDYVKVTKNAERLDVELLDAGIEKGCPVETITIPGTAPAKGRINVNVDGIYKYTTQEPYISGNEVMVTAKNMATFLGMGYYRTDGGYKLTKGDKSFEVKGAGIAAKFGGKDVSLAAAAELKGFQLFVPVSSVAECFGYEYSYDEAAKTVYIKSTKAEGGTEQ